MQHGQKNYNVQQCSVRIITPDDITPPCYQSLGACGFDIAVCETYTLLAGQTQLLETGLVVEVPYGYVLQISPRSSTFRKFGIMMTNSIGIIDQDYCGDNDTIKLSFRNMSEQAVTIEKDTRIAQGVFLAIAKPEFVRVNTINAPNRGGFGSTDTITYQ